MKAATLACATVLMSGEVSASDDDLSAVLVDTSYQQSPALSWWSGEETGWSETSELLEVLLREAAALRSSPLDLNSASAAEFSRIPVLDPADAVAIVSLRRVEGVFARVEDLLGHGRFDDAFVRRLRPYVVCRPPVVPDATARAVAGADVAEAPGPLEWGARVKLSWEVDPDDEWAASRTSDLTRASRSSARFRARGGGGWSAGVGVERDPWERRGIDHVAFHVSLRPEHSTSGGQTLSCTMGDLIVDWGQGLLLSGGGFGGVERFPRRSDRVRGYDGAGESVSRRGAHVSVARGSVTTHVVAARTELDAALDEDGMASTIRTSGLHRTVGERAGRGTLTETCLAARISVASQGAFVLGASGALFRYSPGLAPGDPERQRFRFHGERLAAASVDARATGVGWRLGAEYAMTQEGAVGFVVSASARVGAATAHFGAGHLSRDYWTPTGGGVPGASGGSNATSAWIRVEHRLSRDLAWRAESLVRGRPWRSYHDELPDAGARALLGATWSVAGLGTLDGEVRVRTGAPGAGDDGPEVTSRRRLSIRTVGPTPVVVNITSSRTSSGELKLGEITGIAARCDLSAGQNTLVSVGAASTTSSGEHDAIAQYEPGLPGDFALRTLNTPGARCYIRVEIGVSEQASLTVHISGCPGRDEYSLGVCIDTKG